MEDLEQDLLLYEKNIIINNNMNSIDDLEYIKKYIMNNEKSIDKNKKQNGEVFTPYEIIIKMLDELEKRYFEELKKNIYANKNLKWFDISSGIGNFMTIDYYKLNLGLKNIIKDDIIRKKHILENMLYMSELEKSNVDKWRHAHVLINLKYKKYFIFIIENMGIFL